MKQNELSWGVMSSLQWRYTKRYTIPTEWWKVEESEGSECPMDTK